MKKLLSLAAVAAVSLPLLAQEVGANDDANTNPREDVKRESAMWPAFLAVSEFPASPDVIGLRLTIPFSTVQENVTGFDLGLWGRSLYFQGFQFNILRNDVKDEMSGFQVGLYNSVGGGQLPGGGVVGDNDRIGGLSVGGQQEGILKGVGLTCLGVEGERLGDAALAVGGLLGDLRGLAGRQSGGE